MRADLGSAHHMSPCSALHCPVSPAGTLPPNLCLQTRKVRAVRRAGIYCHCEVLRHLSLPQSSQQSHEVPCDMSPFYRLASKAEHCEVTCWGHMVSGAGAGILTLQATSEPVHEVTCFTSWVVLYTSWGLSNRSRSLIGGTRI